MPDFTLAFDFGLTVLDIAVQSLQDGSIRYLTCPAMPELPPLLQLEYAVRNSQTNLGAVREMVVTGGQHRSMPDQYENVPVRKVPEVQAIAAGGLFLTGLTQALVVSAGSGTAVVVARPGEVRHVTGTAVGGGTLQGLGQLLLGSADPWEIDRLASQGSSAKVNVTIGEAVGGTLGAFPPQVAAVNFGKPARHPHTTYRREDIAAGLAAMVAQEVGIIAALAARAEGLDSAVIMGRLVDLPSIRRNLELVASTIYHVQLHIPPNPGQGTVAGALQFAGKS